MSDPQGEALLKASETRKLKFLSKSILVNVCKEKDLCMMLRFVGCKHFGKNSTAFSCDRELGSCSVAHPRKILQTCLQNVGVTLETFWKISTNSRHEVPNELSNLLNPKCQPK